MASREKSPTSTVPTTSQTRLSAKRPKPQLSCKLCRAKKLRCDRTYPCKNCTKLPPGSCVYVNSSATSNRSKGGSSGTEPSASGERERSGSSGRLQSRIQRLEQLVASLAESSTSTTGNTDISAREDVTANASQGSRAVKDVQISGYRDIPIVDPAPHLNTDDPETRFINSSHWEAILDDIAGIKDELNSSRGSIGGADETAFRSDGSMGPHLLFGCHGNISVQDLICSMPPRSVVESLVDTLMKNTDIPPLLTLLHAPTFENQRQAYWKDPQQVSLAWLSLLYSVMSLALNAVVRMKTKIEGILLPETAAQTYTVRAAQCLLASDYAKPTTYTVEAMMFYMACEHYLMEDGHFRGSILFSTTVRLAYRMGYHRDPSHYREVSIFESEMRRRTWVFMLQVDLMLAQKCGLPRLIDQRQADTLPPSNVLDEDIYPEMTTSPKVRPDEEPTAIAASNYKTRLLDVLGQIVDRTNSSTYLPYEEVLEWDSKLNDQIATRPAWLKPPQGHEEVDPVSSSLNRWVDSALIIYRAQMTLHRKFLVPAQTNARYGYSRQVCLKAAETALEDQLRLYEESCIHPGSGSSNLRFISVHAHDFLLATILIYLDIDQSRKVIQDSSIGNNTAQAEIIKAEIERRIEYVRASHRVWNGLPIQDSDTRKAIRIVEIMLENFRKNHFRVNTTLPISSSEPTPSTTTTTTPPTRTFQDQNSPLTSWPVFGAGFSGQNWTSQAPFGVQSNNSPMSLGQSATGSGQPTTQSGDLINSEDPFQSMFDDSMMQMDWTAWDSQFRGPMMDFYY